MRPGRIRWAQRAPSTWWIAPLATGLVAVVAMPVALGSAASSHHRSSGHTLERTLRGPRGSRGPRGRLGIAGLPGAVGAPGPAGTDASRALVQSVTVNWQNGRPATGDSATFAIPNIGAGQIVCSPDTQWLRVFPADQQDEVTMWLVRQQDGLAPTVRTARHDRFTGRDFNEGLNTYSGEVRSTGSFSGIISSRGSWQDPGGSGPPPTSFHLSFTWDFSDSAAARCYVAGQFVTGS